MDKFILYYYRNKIDGKTYIGRTNRPIKRFKEHLAGEYKTPDNFFHKAITELGVNNNIEAFERVFEMGIIYEEECEHEDRFEVSKRFDELESKYIKEWNTLWPNGYNNKVYSHTKMFNLRKEQIDKQKETYKKNKDNHIKTKNRGSYIPVVFDNREDKETKHNRISNQLSKYYNSEEQIKIREEKKLLTKQQNEQLKQQRKQERDIYWQSDEGQQKILENKEKARQNRIAYNKSDAHRKSAIESNKRRWKNGCPEETRQKMRDSAGKSKGKIWVSKGTETRMINKIDLEKYIEQGYTRGRNYKPHNKK